MSALPVEVVQGEGPGADVAWLHGMFGRGEDWKGVVERVPGRHLLVDLPGHGRARDVDPVTWERTLAMLAETLPPRGGLVGYSLGARVALGFALRFPHRVDRLLLESGAGGLDAEAQAARAALDDGRARELLSDPHGFVQRWGELPLFGPLREAGHQAAITEARRAQLRAAAHRGWARALTGLSLGRQPDHRRAIASLSPPTTWIVGRLDEKFVDLAREMAACAARGRVCAVEGAGHNVHRQAPGRFIRVAREALLEEPAHARRRLALEHRPQAKEAP